MGMLHPAFFCALLFSTAFAREDYYWRPFHGTIPEDAVNATANEDLFIGVGPASAKGDFIGEIFCGRRSITVSLPKGPIQAIDQQVLILCAGSVNNLRWVKANYSTLNDIPQKVVGGYEINSLFNIERGVLYIGRVLRNGVYRVGKVAGYRKGYYDQLYIVENSGEKKFGSYEVLTYTEGETTNENLYTINPFGLINPRR